MFFSNLETFGRFWVILAFKAWTFSMARQARASARNVPLRLAIRSNLFSPFRSSAAIREVVINSAVSNEGGRASKLQFRILTTETDAVPLVEQVKQRPGQVSGPVGW